MTEGTDHVWLVMMKAMRALTKYAAAGIEETGLGISDFGVPLSTASSRKALSAASRAPKTGVCGSSPSPRAARTSLLQPFESIPGR